MDPRDLWGLVGSALVLAWGVMAVIPLKKTSARRLVAAALTGMAFLPLWKGLSAAAYLRGMVGDVSAVTVMLSMMSLFGGEGGKNNARDWFLGMILLSGLILYPLSLGPFAADPYQWGYRPWWILAAVAFGGLILFRRQPSAAYYLAFPVAAFALHLSWSSNLWDYLVDPLVFLYALFSVVRRGVRCALPSGAGFSLN